MIQQLVRGTDAAVARAYLGLFRERSGVLPFLFHSLFRDRRDMARNVLDPLQRTTVAQFREFIGYFLGNGYRFIRPADLLGGLDPGGRYALITFDDGYFNNTLALPVLEEFGVPAVFFISTDHVRQNKSFWWDVLYRERVAQGASERQVYREAVDFKWLRTEEIEDRLAARFGPNAFIPRGDIDRPLTPAELREFARHPFVELGNHTAGHAILTNYTPAEVRGQVAGAQEAVREMAGVTPLAIAYPNGGHNDEIVRTCADLGLKLGFTVRPHKIHLPPGDDPTALMRLGRFTLEADGPLAPLCRTCRSDVLLYGAFRSSYLRFVRGKPGQ